MELCQLQLFHHDFWKENNSIYINSLSQVDQSNPQALSTFYKNYSEKSRKSFDSYNKECWKRNISLINIGYKELIRKMRVILSGGR